MSWYVHPSRKLRDDELPPELVVTNRDGSIEQVYVPYNASDQLKTENAKLRELVRDIWLEGAFEPGACYVDTERLEERTRELGVEVDNGLR